MKPATTEDILDLIDANLPSVAVGLAMETGLFWLLQEKVLDVQGVAEALGIPESRCRHWLQFLCSIGLVEQIASGYVPSPTARSAILEGHSRNTWAVLAREARRRLPVYHDLPEHFGHDGSVWSVSGLTPPEYVTEMAGDREQARRFTRMLYELHGSLGERLAELLDMEGVNRLMDLGGGSGVVSMALLRRHTGLTAMVVDIENVCEAGREIAAEQSLEDRITYHSADLVRDELPSGFDMILECDVNVYGTELFRKVCSCLKPGGRFIIVDLFAPEAGVAPAARVHWGFQASLADPGFSYQTVAETREQLEEAGFEMVTDAAPLPTDAGMSRFETGLEMIEARR